MKAALSESTEARASTDRVEKDAETKMTPTPPRTRSNPINGATPPQRGSRAGNLAISTSSSLLAEQQVWVCFSAPYVLTKR